MKGKNAVYVQVGLETDERGKTSPISGRSEEMECGKDAVDFQVCSDNYFRTGPEIVGVNTKNDIDGQVSPKIKSLV